jgi:subfamily B ATP-binding cassette protein HlyB/CyaB
VLQTQASSEDDASDESGLACLAVLAKYHGFVARPSQLRHDLALNGPLQVPDILRAARKLQLSAKAGPIDLDRVAALQTPLPCIVVMRVGVLAERPAEDDETTGPGVADLSANAGTRERFVILAKFEEGRAYVHDPIEGRMTAFGIEALKACLGGSAVFITSRAQLAAELARFDFSWFVPAIVKYRRLIGEALVATLFVQIFALLTPLLFQVVMDKVLVHKGYATLTVIGIGLLVCRHRLFGHWIA